jgi:hypothetical protein
LSRKERKETQRKKCDIKLNSHLLPCDLPAGGHGRFRQQLFVFKGSKDLHVAGNIMIFLPNVKQSVP